MEPLPICVLGKGSQILSVLFVTNNQCHNFFLQFHPVPYARCGNLFPCRSLNGRFLPTVKPFGKT